MEDHGSHYNQQNQHHFHHQNHNQSHHPHIPQPHIPPPHAHSLRSATESSNSTKITDYVTNHEIKFTKTEGCTPSTCVCLFMALLFVSIAATSGIYFGLRSYDGRLLKERVFKGQFTITNGEPYSRNFEKSDSEEFKSTASRVQSKLNRLFNDSHYAKSFNRCEIIALERKKDTSDDVIVHFNIHMSAQRPDIDGADLFVVLGDEILNAKYGIFKNLTIDYNSLDIQERRWSRESPESSSALLTNPWEQRTRFPGLLEGLPIVATPSPRKCTSIGLPFCNSLSYNNTSYPNIIGHWNISSVEEDFISYRQIIDFECYPLAREFICALLQPECNDDELIMPCRHFCQEFFNSCSDWIPKKLLKKFNCIDFPLSETNNNKKNTINSNKESLFYNNKVKPKTSKTCKSKPGCVSELNTLGLSSNVCDGIYDCPDFSDEEVCDYCSRNQFNCGNKQCIDIGMRCDLKVDCANGFDEFDCFRLHNTTSDTNFATNFDKIYYKPSGYLMSQYRGQTKKVCVESFMNNSISLNKPNHELEKKALQLCKYLNFEKVIRFETRSDSSNKGSFVRLNQIGLNTIKQSETPCNSKQVLYLECDSISCGINPTFTPIEKRISANKGQFWSMSGDWPWFASLTRDMDHYCDATLISNEWLLTSYSCFEDQPSDKIIATLGSVRLRRRSPISKEEREITAMVHSTNGPKGRLTLVRLEEAVNASNYIRPICLPSSDSVVDSLNNDNCVILNWDLKSDRLQFINVKITHSDECLTNDKAYVEGMSSDSLCVKFIDYDDINCSSCGIPGRPLYCSSNDTSKWYLMGIEDNASEYMRPFSSSREHRWYTKSSVHTNWITQIMQSFSKPS